VGQGHGAEGQAREEPLGVDLQEEEARREGQEEEGGLPGARVGAGPAGALGAHQREERHRRAQRAEQRDQDAGQRGGRDPVEEEPQRQRQRPHRRRVEREEGVVERDPPAADLHRAHRRVVVAAGGDGEVELGVPGGELAQERLEEVGLLVVAAGAGLGGGPGEHAIGPLRRVPRAHHELEPDHRQGPEHPHRDDAAQAHRRSPSSLGRALRRARARIVRLHPPSARIHRRSGGNRRVSGRELRARESGVPRRRAAGTARGDGLPRVRDAPREGGPGARTQC